MSKAAVDAVPLSPPVPLALNHDLNAFFCGDVSLDDWLKKRARANHAGGAGRVFVVREGSRVIAYYSLSSSSIVASAVSGRIKRNMPGPVPVVLLGRLAIDVAYQRRGIGRSIVRDAAIRVAHAADIIGVRGIIVHALSNDAYNFYLKLGFSPCLHEPMMLVILLADLQTGLGLKS